MSAVRWDSDFRSYTQTPPQRRLAQPSARPSWSPPNRHPTLTLADVTATSIQISIAIQTFVRVSAAANSASDNCCRLSIKRLASHLFRTAVGSDQVPVFEGVPP